MFIPEFVIIGLGLFFGWILVTALVTRAARKRWITTDTSGILILLETCLFAAAAGFFVGQGLCG